MILSDTRVCNFFERVCFVAFVLYLTKCHLLFNFCPNFLSNLKELFCQCDFCPIQEFVIFLCNKFLFCRPGLKKNENSPDLLFFVFYLPNLIPTNFGAKIPPLFGFLIWLNGNFLCFVVWSNIFV